MARFLILPGDVRYNYGDTAILLGTCELVRRVDPDASIAVASPRPLLPGGFEGVEFTGGSFGDIFRAARRADVVLWGGGQLLQGNRSRLKIPYWMLRLAVVRLAGNPPVVGVGQGVGPLPRGADRRLTARLVRKTAGFTVRDEDSRSLLEKCGVNGARVRVAADPALLLGRAEPPTRTASSRLRVGLSLRYTGHHRAKRVIPFQRLSESKRLRVLEESGFPAFVERWSGLAKRMVEELDVDLCLVPTYPAPWETDVPASERVAAAVGRPDRVRVWAPRDSVGEITDLLGDLDALVAIPMHATILAAGQHCPTLGVYYEPKGRAFLESVGLPGFPAAEGDGEVGAERLFAAIEELLRDRDRVRGELGRRIEERRNRAGEVSSVIAEALRTGQA